MYDLPHRHRRDTAVTWAALGFLAGLIFGLASCAPDTPPCRTTTAMEQSWNG